VYDAIASRAHWVHRARIELPRNRELNVAEEFLVCPRRVLDQLLLERACELGGTFVPNFQVDFLLQRGNRVFGVRSKDGREIHAPQTVVADGVHSKFAADQGPRRLVQTIMGWWDTDSSCCDHLEFVFDRALKPYYGWRFPEAPTRVNIGIGYEDASGRMNARAVFSEFLERHYADFLANARQVGDWKGQQISYSFKTGKLTSPGRIVVGEAGRIVDPASGEGIYQALHSGTLAAQVLHRILSSNIDPACALLEYESACRKAFDGSFRLGRIIRFLAGHGGLDAVARFVPQRLLVGLCNMTSHPSLKSPVGAISEA
jgi:flavin-dependent dehydrogenase